MKYEQPEREWIRCEDCHKAAIIKIKDGWKKKIKDEIKPHYINVCFEHYSLRHLDIAQKWNHDNELDTEEKRKKYCFNAKFSFKKIV